MKLRIALILTSLAGLACAQSQSVLSRDCPKALPQLPVRFAVAPIAATHSQLRGRVVGAKDSSVLPAAVLTLEQQRSHRRMSSADSAGTFLLDSLAPGSYVLITQAIGFGVRRDTVELRPSRASILLIPLNPIPPWECGSFAATPRPYRTAARPHN